MSVDVAIIVVGINSRSYVRECLSSLQCTDWQGYSHEVIYIDNASSDGSVAMVQQEFPAVRVLENQRNAGFCQACNQGVAASESRYVYLLNNDTVLLPHSVAPLIRFLDSMPSAGAAANRLLNPDGSDQWSARRFPTWANALFGRRTFAGKLFPNSKLVKDYLYKDRLALPDPFAVDWVPGSCSMMRRSAYQQVGGLPQSMHYWSDTVFCHRLAKAGWHVFILPNAPLIHHEGKGTGGKNTSLRRWLISDFHNGAYLFYCEFYELGFWSFTRLLARFGLSARASLLIAADRLSNLQSRS